MSTPGMQWAQLIGSMMGQGNQQLLEKQGMEASKQQKQQQLDMEEKEQQRRAQDADHAFAEHLQQLGARPVINGVVKRPMTVPGGPGGPEATGMLLDQADPARTIKHKTADGEQVQFELPSLHEQVMYQWNAQAPVRSGQVQQEQDMSRAKAYGAVTGQEKARTDERKADGIQLTPADRQRLGVPEGYTPLPEEVPALVRPWWQNQSTQARVEGAKDIADTRVQGAADRNQASIDARAALQKSKQQFDDEQHARRLQYQDKWAAARNAIVGQTQNSLNSRALMHQFDAQQKQHGALLDQTYKEQQKQLAAQALLDPKATPDNTEFLDPWSGKKATMNYAQRLRLQNAAAASGKQVQGWKQRADGISSKFGLDAQQPQQQQQQQQRAATPGGAPAAPAAPAAQPKATASKYQVGQTVMLKDGRKVTIKKLNPNGTFEF